MSTVISTPRPTVLARARAEFERRLVEAADRLHAAGDELAREQGWTVTRAGAAGRAYRDPRFDTLGGAR